MSLDKELERLEDKKEARADGGRQFQREGPATKKDLDLAIVVVVRGTKSSPCQGSVEDEGVRQRAEVGWHHTDIQVPPLTIWALRLCIQCE